MPRNLLTQAARLVVCLLVSCCALAACNRADDADSQSSAASFDVHQYVVRAEIITLPTETDPDAELKIRHEMIPDFHGQDGQHGMKAMTMPFPTADELDLSPFSVGDKVSLTFTVDYDRQEDKLLAYRATKLEPLPADTTLVFLRVDAYTVRARVTSLPDPANPLSEFAVHHERIDEFKASGDETGMNAMVMPFPLAEGLSLSRLKPGDIIELTFTVDFNIKQDKPVAYRATRWSPLPTDTHLNLTPSSAAAAVAHE